MNSENKKTTNNCYRWGDNGQIPQKHRKPRLKWTKELHQHFVQVVNQLGGAYEAAPRNIVKLMDVQGITRSHIQSHLQKYRHSKEFCKIAGIKATENVISYEANQENKYSNALGWHIHESRDIQKCKAHRLSIEGQRKFQAESEKSEKFQQQLQCSQAKNLIAALEWIPETSEEAKSKKDQLYEPVNGYQTSIHSLSSCLTFCKATKNNHETHKVDAEADSNTQLALKGIEKKHKLQTDDTTWLAAIKKDSPLYSSLRDRDRNVEEVEAKQKPANDSTTISIRLRGTKANSSSRSLEGGPKTRAEYYNNFCDLDPFAAQVEPIGVPNKSKLTSFTENGLNFASNYQPFDLNVSILDEQLGQE